MVRRQKVTSRTVLVSAFTLLCKACAIAPTAKPQPDEFSLVPNPKAPDAVREEYGQFVGSWSCQGYNRQQDGRWQASPGRATWNWYYVMDGFAIQDVWIPSTASTGGALGINLRTYDAESANWQMVWATGRQPDFDIFLLA